MKIFSTQKIPLTRILFFIYCFLIVWCTVFKMSFRFQDIAALIGPRRFNLIPFYYACDISPLFHIREVLLNVLLFFPFGVYLKMLDTPCKKAFLYGASISLAIELCQLVFALGTFDITDFITNTAGTVIGICFHVILIRCFKNRTAVNKILRVLALTATLLMGLLILCLYFAS